MMEYDSELLCAIETEDGEPVMSHFNSEKDLLRNADMIQEVMIDTMKTSRCHQQGYWYWNISKKGNVMGCQLSNENTIYISEEDEEDEGGEEYE